MSFQRLFLGLLISVPMTATAEVKMLVPQSLQRIPVTTNPLSLPASSQYRTLESKFGSAKAVLIDNLKGWYSGRCFFKDSPSKAVATLLVADQASASKVNGPAFSDAEYRHVTPLVDLSARADQFDAPTSSLRTSVNNALSSSRELNAYPVQSNGAMVVAGHRTTKLESRVYRLRQEGRFTILKVECAENNYCTNFSGWGHNKFLEYEGQAVAYCYYFKKAK